MLGDMYISSDICGIARHGRVGSGVWGKEGGLDTLESTECLQLTLTSIPVNHGGMNKCTLPAAGASEASTLVSVSRGTGPRPGRRRLSGASA